MFSWAVGGIAQHSSGSVSSVNDHHHRHPVLSSFELLCFQWSDLHSLFVYLVIFNIGNTNKKYKSPASS